ncbi:MAG: dipeptide epimerase [Nocardioides sp.]
MSGALGPVITGVQTRRLRARLHTPFVTALRRTEYAETLVVTLTDSDGRTGWGEAPQVWRVTGDSIIGSEAAVTGPLAEAVVGLPVDAAMGVIQGALVGNRAAKMAMDLACWDLRARTAGLPLAQSLTVSLPQGRFGNHTVSDWAAGRTVRTDITLAAGSIDDLVAAATDRVAEGFEVIKVKVGARPADDLAAVLAVRHAVGPGPRLRLDANTGWDARQAVEIVTALEDAGADLELVEQPTRARDLDALGYVTRHVNTPVIADESVFDLDDMVDVVRTGAADGVNLKLAKTGGLTPALDLAHVAVSHGLSVLVGSMMETHLGVAAAAALSLVINPDGVNDLDAAWWIAGSPYLGGLEQSGPALVLSDSPGSGIVGLADGGQ